MHSRAQSRSSRATSHATTNQQGTYFLVADVSSLLRPGEDDVALCKRLTVEAGVTVIPLSAFYASGARPHHLVRCVVCVREGAWAAVDQPVLCDALRCRWCFCKDDAKLTAACDKLAAYISAQGSSS